MNEGVPVPPGDLSKSQEGETSKVGGGGGGGGGGANSPEAPLEYTSARRRPSPLRFTNLPGSFAPSPAQLSRTPSDEALEGILDPPRAQTRGRVPKLTTSEGLLALVLNKVSDHLDLTGKVILNDEPVAVRGGFSDVFKGYCPTMDKKVAVKRLRLHVGGNWDVIKYFANAIRIWARLSHPNVMHLLGYTVEGGYRSLVSEWMENGSLRVHMVKLSTEELFSMAIGIAKGLCYLHSNKVIHSDLKADNVLVSPTGEPLLADFGISKLEASSSSSPAGLSTESVRGSTRWLAYEFFEIRDDDNDAFGRSSHNEKTDVWAFGMTILELLSGDVPFAKIRNDLKVIFAIVNKTLPSEPALSDGEPASDALRGYMWTICSRCWTMEPAQRPTMGELLKEMEEYSPVREQRELKVEDSEAVLSTT
ncbi:kinase-like protein [Schizopora paradoxa]|uniref:Kinase-like protein n=1 Tax=Schizopora paradoxa TaxID=27342 RepID=A0A0H2RS52_9AGAM|nr:kinase-like protein [Schizopora paradoxa]